MKKNIKKFMAAGMAVLTVTSMALPTFAETRINDISEVNISGSAIGEAIIDRTSTIDAKGEDICVVKSDELNVVNSYIETLIDSGITSINVKGQDIDITNLDAVNIYDSAVVTVLKQKASIINAKEKAKKARCW